MKKIHIIGIGGSASSAIAEYLMKNKIQVSGSEMKSRSGLEYLEKMGVRIFYQHNKNNLTTDSMNPDIVLYSPAITALNPDNPEILESRRLNIPLMSWQTFIGDYLNQMNKTGITVSGSEGKGTTAGILTHILKDTEFDPLSILGAKIKNIHEGKDSNIYIGNGSTYIMEGDEFGRNFHHYHPSINITVNFEFEHPETYRDFNDYQESFFQFFKNMNSPKKLIFRATDKLIHFVDRFEIDRTHKVIWFGDKEQLKFVREGSDQWLIRKHVLDKSGNTLVLDHDNRSYEFRINSLPGYLQSNGTGAIIAAYELGLPISQIQGNIRRFKGMVRRFDVYKTSAGGVFITDYGHSPGALRYIINEIRTIYPEKKLHLVFQPHLFSRTYNFLEEFIDVLKLPDQLSLLEIYPARENRDEWVSRMTHEILLKTLREKQIQVHDAGHSSQLLLLKDQIDPSQVCCFIGAGDMDQYFEPLFKFYNAKN